VASPLVSIVIPTYNEKHGIAALIDAILDQFEAAGVEGEIVVVDDNSPDRTWELCEELGQTRPVRVLRRAGKLGLSSAVIDGFKIAHGAILGVMDADGSHDPRAIPLLIHAIERDGYDLAVGSRYISGGRIKDWPLLRLIISRGAVLLASPLTPIKDITSGFFFMRREVIDGVKLNPIGFKIALEVFVKGRYERYCEVPYTFVNRLQGKSKLTLKQMWEYVVQLFDLVVYRLFNRRAGKRRA
jgi:dolichol-phosphate mannosyltransferase